MKKTKILNKKKNILVDSLFKLSSKKTKLNNKKYLKSCRNKITKINLKNIYKHDNKRKYDITITKPTIYIKDNTK